MTNEPEQPSQSTADRVFSTLAQLIATNPDAAQEISDVMLYIRSLESKCRDHAPQHNSRPTEQQNPNASQHSTFAYSPPYQQIPHAYHWTPSALREHPHGEARSHLQVNYDDYKKVAKAIAECKKINELMTAADIGATVQKISGRRIPPTQMYLCIRYWRTNKLISQAGSGKFRVNDNSSEFIELAKDLMPPQ